MPSPRRFPSPWTVEEQPARSVVRDDNGQALAYVYFEDEPDRRSAAELVAIASCPNDQRLGNREHPFLQVRF
jgi:hypothetical protein